MGLIETMNNLRNSFKNNEELHMHEEFWRDRENDIIESKGMQEESISRKVLEEIKARFSDEEFITNICLSVKHKDYGRISMSEREHLRAECIEFMNAIINNWGYHIKPKPQDLVAYLQYNPQTGKIEGKVEHAQK